MRDRLVRGRLVHGRGSVRVINSRWVDLLLLAAERSMDGVLLAEMGRSLIGEAVRRYPSLVREVGVPVGTLARSSAVASAVSGTHSRVVTGVVRDVVSFDAVLVHVEGHEASIGVFITVILFELSVIDVLFIFGKLLVLGHRVHLVVSLHCCLLRESISVEASLFLLLKLLLVGVVGEVGLLVVLVGVVDLAFLRGLMVHDWLSVSIV
jgi:hypothetical protein